ncbi:cytochrome P450 [uncultured Jatrophihabitans sp.]|uniref:cytochrome P450 n=1 Tax=uncultured Jatrophihabitans sp. TaxID=1610747 RepID=UPI0035C9E26A
MTQSEQGATCPVVRFEFSPVATPGESFFAQLDELRREHRVFRSDEAQGYWVLARNDLIVEALQHPETFSSVATVPTMPDPPFRWIPIMLDPPGHTKWRRLLGGWFSPGRTAKLETPVREMCTTLVDGLVDGGRCEFVADFAARFPTTIFLQIIGLPVSELSRFMAWEDKILHFDSETDPDYSQMMTAMNEVTAMFSSLIAERRADPSRRADDIISASLDWQIDGRPVSDDDVLSCLLLLFMAGLDTVASQLSFMLHHLATHDRDRRALVEDPNRIPGAVEEMLRAHAIVRVGRKVARDVDFHGCPMKAGDMVSMPLAFASRDEDVFQDATTVDIDRPSFANLAFGAGPHRCLGSHLARRELVVALEEWHRRIPEYQVTPGAQVLEHAGNGVYGVDSLPLSW